MDYFFDSWKNAGVFGGYRTHGSMVSSMFSSLWPHRAAFDVLSIRFEVTWLCPIESLFLYYFLFFLLYKKPKDAFLRPRRCVQLF